MHRVADAFPLEVLEAAYLRKLDAMPQEAVPWLARTTRDKLGVMRRVFAAWCRASSALTLGELQSAAFPHELGNEILDKDNAGFVNRLETMYPPKK